MTNEDKKDGFSGNTGDDDSGVYTFSGSDEDKDTEKSGSEEAEPEHNTEQENSFSAGENDPADNFGFVSADSEHSPEITEPEEEDKIEDIEQGPDDGAEEKEYEEDNAGTENGGGSTLEYPGNTAEKKTDDTGKHDSATVSPEESAPDFVPVPKENYDKVAGGKKPIKLDKPLIIKIVFGVIIAVSLLIVFQPQGCSKKSKSLNDGKADPSEVKMGDYKSMAPQKNKFGETENTKSPGSETEPPTDDAYTYKPEEKKEPDKTYAISGGAGAPERPDTRRDSLYTSISGIKGLSGTRSNYATDYEKTVEKNASDSAKENAAQNVYARTGLPDKSEMLASALAAAGQGNSYANQNDQSGKSKFHSTGSDKAGTGEYLAPNSVWEGSIFEAELLSAVNTDLPGEITARITKNVYSSQTGEYLLIPQNSYLIGSYNSSISYSQSRVQVAWNTIIRPDGYRIDIGNMNASDAHGAAGMTGFINDHPMQYLKAIGLMSVFNIVNGELKSVADKTNNSYVQNAMANSQEVSTTLGNKLIDRAMDVQPTINIPAGTVIKIVANQTLTLPPFDAPPVADKYRRNDNTGYVPEDPGYHPVSGAAAYGPAGTAVK